MKRFASILLVGLLLFNWGGYRLFFLWKQQQHNCQLESRLDKNDYREADLLEFSIPLDIPYQTDWAAFQRTDGEIVIKGISYHFVKKKVQNNRLVIKYISNPGKNAVAATENNFFKLVNDIQSKSSKKSGAGSEVNNFSNCDYDKHGFFQYAVYAAYTPVKAFLSAESRFSSLQSFNAPAQPPEAVLS